MGGKISKLQQCCSNKTKSDATLSHIPPSNNPVFGVPLTDAKRSENHPLIPKIVVECVECIERGDLIQTKGVYRLSGVKVKIDAAIHSVILPRAIPALPHVNLKYNLYGSTSTYGELPSRMAKRLGADCGIHVDGKYEIIPALQINTVTGLLKQYFRDLPTGIVSSEAVSKLFPSGKGVSSDESRQKLREFLQQLEPKEHYETLKYLINHLKNVSQFSEKNEMDAFNLSVVWGACLFLADLDYSPNKDITFYNEIVKVLIENYDEMFE